MGLMYIRGILIVLPLFLEVELLVLYNAQAFSLCAY